MLPAEDIQEILISTVVIVVIAVILVLAWKSTYVQEWSVISTTVVVIHQQRENENSHSSRTTDSHSGIRVSMETGTSSATTGDQECHFREIPISENISEANTGSSASDRTTSGSSDFLPTASQLESPEEGNHCRTDEETQNVSLKSTSLLDVQSLTATSSHVTPVESSSSPLYREYIEELESEIPVCVRRRNVPSSVDRNIELQDDQETGIVCDTKTTSQKSCKTNKDGLEIRDNTALSQKENSEQDVPVIVQAEAVEKDSDSTGCKDDAETNVDEEQELEQRGPGSIRIRLKFLDDTQKLVFGNLNDEVGTFKRDNFALEIAANRVVRLIFNGHLLNQDSSTLQQCGLFDNCVVHCHVSHQRTTAERGRNGRGNTSNSDDVVDLSEFLMPLLFGVLIALWYLRFQYSHLFNTSATVILVCLTTLLLGSHYAFSVTLNVSFGRNSGSSGQPDSTDENYRRGSSSDNTSRPGESPSHETTSHQSGAGPSNANMTSGSSLTS